MNGPYRTPPSQDLKTAMNAALAPLKAELLALRDENEKLTKLFPKPQHLNAIPGRRVYYTLMGTQTFVSTTSGRGQPIFFETGKDGYWVMTHYPIIMWKPVNGTDLGRWRPVSSEPLATQTLSTNFIDVSYELSDVGPYRNMQNIPVLPALVSRPDAYIPLNLPALFAAHSIISLTPTYEKVLLQASATSGTLSVALPGYKIIDR